MSETNDDAAREQHEAKTKAAYKEAIANLFRLLEMPADKKGPDHRAKLMEANDACGTTRTAMLAAWEPTGEKEESWPR